jgi:hypothetical protein
LGGRTTLLLIVAGAALLVGRLFYLKGDQAWRYWNIPTVQPAFVDLRILTAGSESNELGYNPDLENPRDPFGRRFNLPAVWHLFFHLGLDQSDTSWLASILIGAFLAGLALFSWNLPLPAGLLVLLAALSPPVMLAFERGNVELLIFFLFALALSLRSEAASGLLALAAMLKIFPIFGLTALLRLPKNLFFRWSAGVVIAFILYVALTFENFRRIFGNTEKGFDLSYGALTLGLYALQAGAARPTYITVTVVSCLAVFGLLVLALGMVNRRAGGLPAQEPRQLDAFRLGAGIYLGTFLLGSNWDYRLMFLLFTLPQLLEWARQVKLAQFTLAAVGISLGYLWLLRLTPLAYFLDEFANWLVFAGLLYLFLASAPDWLRGEIRSFFERRRMKTA